MSTKEPPFAKGRWNVVEQQLNLAGKWVSRNRFESGEWTLYFWPYGRYSECFFDLYARPGCWKFNPKTGIISISYTELFVEKRIFCDTGTEVFLYCFDDKLHIRPDSSVIVEHHAHQRLRLTR